MELRAKARIVQQTAFGHHVAVPSDLLTDFLVGAHGRDISYSRCVPLSDLLIAVTRFELGYGVATANVPHFRFIPGLSIMPVEVVRFVLN